MDPKGTSTPHVSLDDRYRQTAGRVLLSGVQALVRLCGDQRRADTAAGLDTGGFVTGYPGSPLAGLDLELARRSALLAEWGVVHRPALNEELAATAVAGSQLAGNQPDRTQEGVVALWYGKAPGLDRASDALRHGNLMGAGPTGGVLVCVGDDPQAKSSSVPSSSEPTLYALAMPILAPADPQEVLDLGRHGIALSRVSGLWVGLRLAASVADATQSVDVAEQRLDTVVPDRSVDGVPFAHRVSAQLLGATLLELESSLYGPRIEMARRYGVANELNRVTHGAPGDVLGVVAAGPAYLTVLSALRRLGYREGDLARVGVRLFKVALPHPLDAGVVRAFARGLREVVVVEDKRPFLETLVRDALYGAPSAPPVLGKRDDEDRPLVPITGEVDTDAVARVLARRLAALTGDERARAFLASTPMTPPAPLPVVRGAYFCSGCPHSSSVRVPEGSCVGSGSGCHGLAIQMDPHLVGTVVGRFQMGGEGAMWNGMSPFVAAEHFFQNIGDGTLAHSGSLAVRAAVAAKVNITFKLLVNATVAMTGGQPINGGRGLADLVRELRAEGVRRVIVTTDDPGRTRAKNLPRDVDVWPRHRIIEAQRLLAATKGVTVLIHDQECAAELRRHRKQGLAAIPSRRVHINTRLCEGCGDCGATSNCLSVRPVDTAHGTKRQIHQESCNLDFTCLDGRCPALVTVRPRPGEGARRVRVAASGDADLEDGLEDPTPRFDRAGFTVRLTGIGGTGILTVAQIVAMAAHLEGRAVRELDQTGIAQKGGAVVSDLRISAHDEALSPRLGEGECDLYLGGDPLVAATTTYLNVTSPARTVAVVSTTTTPTGRQVFSPDAPTTAPAQLRALVDGCTRPDANVWIDAGALSRERLGSDTYANVVLLGAAFQCGALGLGADALRRAIEVNGVDVATNLRAFAVGRRAVASGATPTQRAVEVTAGSDESSRAILETLGATPEGSLAAVVTERIGDLIDYQDLDYARRYGDVVRRARAAEASIGLGDEVYSTTVARELHRLMAYKDEYEVARLHRAPAARADVERAFGPGARVTFHLTAPWRRASAHAPKRAVGAGATWTFHLLRASRRLRESPLDPFGRSPLRREERRLRDEYAATVDQLSATLSKESLARAIALAEAPSQIRGFGALKGRAIAQYDERRRELLAAP